MCLLKKVLIILYWKTCQTKHKWKYSLSIILKCFKKEAKQKLLVFCHYTQFEKLQTLRLKIKQFAF